MKFCFGGRRYSRRALKKMGAVVSGEVFVQRSVTVFRGAKLEGPCIVRGNSVLCEGCEVGAFSCVNDSFIGRGAILRASTAEGARVGENSTVGPYAFLRGGAVIGNNCRIGDFVEVKNAKLAEGCKAAHLSYIGDADIGAGCNIGCGVVFANYDGAKKHKSRVGEGCFIGCNCNIVAPISIENGAYIAAGTTVTRDVAAGELCVGRARQRAVPQGAEGRYVYGNILRN